MKKIILMLLGCWMAGQVLAADSQWLTSFSDAQTAANKEHKLLLLDFTGSDWCPPCIKLEQEVFSKPQFSDYAKTNLVLVKLDFPAGRQPASLRAANEALGHKFDVSGFPTVLVLKPDGKVIWKHEGFLEGGPTAMVAKLEELKGK